MQRETNQRKVIESEWLVHPNQDGEDLRDILKRQIKRARGEKTAFACPDKKGRDLVARKPTLKEQCAPKATLPAELGVATSK